MFDVNTIPQEYRINWDGIENARDKGDLKRRTVAEIKRVKYVCLTEVLIEESDRGPYMKEALAKEAESGQLEPTDVINYSQRREYKIRVLCDEWGDKPKPGDVVRWKSSQLREDDRGKALTTRKIKKWARLGRGIDIQTQAIVDKDGCITVGFREASDLLREYGKYTCKRKEKMGPIPDGPKTDPNHVGKYIHYHRYEEVFPWEEKQKKTRRRPKQTQPETPAVNETPAPAEA